MTPRASRKLHVIPNLHRATHAVALALESHAELDVTQAEAHILAHLAETGEARISELHQRFGHRRSTLTSVLDRLENRNLIRRESDPADRRSFVITMSKEGRLVAAKVHRALEEIEDAALGGMSEGNRARVTTALDAIAATAAEPVRRT